MSFPRISDGTFLVYRLFDVAEDIDLDQAEAAVAGTAERLRLAGERTGFLELPERPLSVEMGARELLLEDGTRLVGTAHVRLFAHGVASVRYEVPLPVGADATLLAAWVGAAADSAILERAARGEARDLCARLGDALHSPHESPLFETYAIAFVRALADGAAIADVAGIELARVLAGEPPRVALSSMTISQTTRHRFSYAEGDLCVLDWDSAVVVEPTGDLSVAHVLELATAQLLEFRYYDARFEREILDVARSLSRPRAGLAWLAFGRYGRVLRRVQDLVVDSAEFGTRVANAVRIVGDLHLARIHRAASERFRIPEWQEGVRRRELTAVQVATMLRSESSALLGHVLEAAILVLILFEVAMALFVRR